MAPLNHEVHLLASSGLLNQFIAWDLPNATWCFGIKAMKEAKKRNPFVLRVDDLAGLFPLMGLMLGIASAAFLTELLVNFCISNKTSGKHIGFSDFPFTWNRLEHSK